MQKSIGFLSICCIVWYWTVASLCFICLWMNEWISLAPLQTTLYSEALPTTARTLAVLEFSRQSASSMITALLTFFMCSGGGVRERYFDIIYIYNYIYIIIYILHYIHLSSLFLIYSHWLKKMTMSWMMKNCMKKVMRQMMRKKLRTMTTKILEVWINSYLMVGLT